MAQASRISRVTIVNLENGKVGDIGAVKLAQIAENVGAPLFTSGKKMDFLMMALNNVNTSYKKPMSLVDMEKLMLTGEVQPGFEGQVMHLIDEAPTSLVAGAVKQLAMKKNMNAKLLWKNLANVAAEIQTSNKFWSSVG